jgi:hypothetical protein
MSDGKVSALMISQSEFLSQAWHPRGLMERDEWRNLGMDNLGKDAGDKAAVASKDSNSSTDSVVSKNP